MFSFYPSSSSYKRYFSDINVLYRLIFAFISSFTSFFHRISLSQTLMMPKNIGSKIPNLKWALFRTKPFNDDLALDSSLQRNLSLFEVIMFGIGAMLGNSIYHIPVMVMKENSGTSQFLAFVIASIVALLNGLCFCELASHMPRAGSSYTYTYVIAGEFFAFIVGWLMLLEYCLSISAAAVSFSYNLDFLTNGTISSAMIKGIGRLGEGGALNDYYNFPALMLCLAFIVVMYHNNIVASSVNVFCCVLTILCILIATLYMFAEIDPDTVKLVTSGKNFIPKDAFGFLYGSAVAFNAFIGFNVISMTGEEAHNPRRNIPLSINISILAVLLITFVHGLALVLYTPWWTVNSELGLASVYVSLRSKWAWIMTGLAAVCSSIASMVCFLYAFPRIVYSMAEDGLLFPFVGWISPKSKTPVISVVIVCIICAVLSFILKHSTVIEYLNLGTLLSYTMVACDVIILRYMKFGIYDVSNCEAGFLYFLCQCCTFLDKYRRGTVVVVTLVIYTCLCCITSAFLWNVYPQISEVHGWKIFLTIVFVIGLVICVLIIAIHRHHKGGSHFNVSSCNFIIYYYKLLLHMLLSL